MYGILNKKGSIISNSVKAAVQHSIGIGSFAYALCSPFLRNFHDSLCNTGEEPSGDAMWSYEQ